MENTEYLCLIPKILTFTIVLQPLIKKKKGLYINISDNVNFTNIIVKNNNVSDTDYIGGVKIENSSGIKFTSCQSYDDRTPMLQEYGIRTVGDVDFVEIINCILTPNEKYAICNDVGAVITESNVVLD